MCFYPETRAETLVEAKVPEPKPTTPEGRGRISDEREVTSKGGKEEVG